MLEMYQYKRFCDVVHDSHMRNVEVSASRYNDPALQSLSFLDGPAWVASISRQVLDRDRRTMMLYFRPLFTAHVVPGAGPAGSRQCGS